MALSIESKFKRHTKQCTKGYAVEDHNPEHDNCDCKFSIAVQFRIQKPNGEVVPDFIRKTTGQSTHKAANAVIRAASDRGYWIDVIAEKRAKKQADSPSPPKNGHPIRDVANAFVECCCESTLKGKLKKATRFNYQATMNLVVDWCKSKGILNTEDITTNHMDLFKVSLGHPFGRRKKGFKPSSATNCIIRMHGFGAYCLRNGYSKIDFAEHLKCPKGKHILRPPFADEEFNEIIRQASIVTKNRPKSIDSFEVVTFIFVMRYTGMAVVDAAMMTESAIVGNEVHYYRIKTERDENRVLVKVPLEPWLLERLAELRRRGTHKHGKDKYYFTRQSIDTRNAATAWRYYLKPIFAAAGIEGCPTHRFRHTFAEDMLTRIVLQPDGKGYGPIPVKIVAGYLGHADEATTRKHYRETIERREQAGAYYMEQVFLQNAQRLAVQSAA